MQGAWDARPNRRGHLGQAGVCTHVPNLIAADQSRHLRTEPDWDGDPVRSLLNQSRACRRDPLACLDQVQGRRRWKDPHHVEPGRSQLGLMLLFGAFATASKQQHE